MYVQCNHDLNYPTNNDNHELKKDNVLYNLLLKSILQLIWFIMFMFTIRFTSGEYQFLFLE